MRELRPMVKRLADPTKRREAFHTLCSDAAVDELSAGGIDRLRAWLTKQYPELQS
jgi:hypothetical protein